MAKSLIFVSSHRSAGRVVDRIAAALATNRSVQLLSFDRKVVDHPVDYDQRVQHISLGDVRGGVALSRLFAILRATWTIVFERRRLNTEHAVLLVNSLELLIVCRLCGLTRMPTIFDVSDIHPLQLSRSITGRFMRWLERRMLRHVQLLVVTSPWFYWEYYRGWLRSSPTAVLIENKIDRDCAGEVPRPSLGLPCIAWSGLLRCQISADVLRQSLQHDPGTLRIQLHGTLDRLGESGARLIRESGCEFTGTYLPEQLGGLLTRSNFIWAIDLSEGYNSKWLLPCRLYSALAAGIPVIALEGTATGEVVKRHDIGLVLADCTAKALLAALASCEAPAYERWLANSSALRTRAIRRDEWMLVLDDVAGWSALRHLPDSADVDLVFRTDSAMTYARTVAVTQ